MAKRPRPHGVVLKGSVMKYVLHYALVFLIAVVAPHITARAFPRLLASFTASPQTWDATFETNPANSDSVAQADDHMRQIKGEVRERVETEMDFGALGNVTSDTGRLLAGAARAFRQNTAPTVNGSITATCLTEADWDGNRGCDGNRFWIDADGPDNIASNGDDNTLNVSVDSDSDGDADSWVNVVGNVPVGALILWDSSNTCPGGYTEATEFRGVAPRGADIGATTVNVPNNAGVTCGPLSYTAGATACGATGGQLNYNDTLSIAEMPAHTHEINTNIDSEPNDTTGTMFPRSFVVNSVSTLPTEANGFGEDHVHPIRSVLFCRKS